MMLVTIEAYSETRAPLQSRLGHIAFAQGLVAFLAAPSDLAEVRSAAAQNIAES